MLLQMLGSDWDGSKQLHKTTAAARREEAAKQVKEVRVNYSHLICVPPFINGFGSRKAKKAKNAKKQSFKKPQFYLISSSKPGCFMMFYLGHPLFWPHIISVDSLRTAGARPMASGSGSDIAREPS